jgi:hypothetical protein
MWDKYCWLAVLFSAAFSFVAPAFVILKFGSLSLPATLGVLTCPIVFLAVLVVSLHRAPRQLHRLMELYYRHRMYQ